MSENKIEIEFKKLEMTPEKVAEAIQALLNTLDGYLESSKAASKCIAELQCEVEKLKSENLKLKKEVWYLKNQDGTPYPEGDE